MTKASTKATSVNTSTDNAEDATIIDEHFDTEAMAKAAADAEAAAKAKQDEIELEAKIEKVKKSSVTIGKVFLAGVVLVVGYKAFKGYKGYKARKQAEMQASIEATEATDVLMAHGVTAE